MNNDNPKMYKNNKSWEKKEVSMVKRPVISSRRRQMTFKTPLKFGAAPSDWPPDGPMRRPHSQDDPSRDHIPLNALNSVKLVFIDLTHISSAFFSLHSSMWHLNLI